MHSLPFLLSPQLGGQSLASMMVRGLQFPSAFTQLLLQPPSFPLALGLPGNGNWVFVDQI